MEPSQEKLWYNTKQYMRLRGKIAQMAADHRRVVQFGASGADREWAEYFAQQLENLLEEHPAPDIQDIFGDSPE